MLRFILLTFAVVLQTEAQRPDLPNNVQLQLNPMRDPAEITVSTLRFNFFDMELFKEVANTKPNVCISPASIKTTLAMILEGSHGRCAEEISSVLRIPKDQNDVRDKLKPLLYDLSDKGQNTLLESSNGVFVSNKYEVVPAYRNKLEQFYRAFAKSIDFSNAGQASHLINTWVSNNTHGLITEIVTAENFRNDASIVITNAIYFKGLWKKAFDQQSTTVKCFSTPTRDCLNVYMMQNIDTYNYNFSEELDAHIIELPYDDNKYAMVIILPKQKKDIHLLVRDLQQFRLSKLLGELQETEVLLDLPRFDIEYESDMAPALKNLAIVEMFRSSANLSGIVRDGNVYVTNIVHKCKIEVNERGTEAAAATGAIVIPLMGSSRPRMIVDHPFAFFIHHRKFNNIIFEGVINEPTEAFDNQKQRGNVQQQQPISYDSLSSYPTNNMRRF